MSRDLSGEVQVVADRRQTTIGPLGSGRGGGGTLRRRTSWGRPRTSLMPRNMAARARWLLLRISLRRSAVLSLSLIGDKSAMARCALMAAVLLCRRIGVPTIKLSRRCKREPAAKINFAVVVYLIKLAIMLAAVHIHTMPRHP